MKENTSRTKKTAVNTAFSVASQGLTIVLNFVLRTAFIKILGDQYTGVSSVFTTVLTMLSLTELGFSTAIATSLYSPLKEKDTGTIRQLMAFYRNAYRVVAGIVFSVGLLLIPFLNYIIKDVPDIKENIIVVYVFYLVKSAASYLMIYKTTLLVADQKAYVVKKLEMLCLLVRYTVEVIALLIFRNYMAYLVIEVIATILQNYVVTKRAEKAYPEAFEKPEVPLPKERVRSLFRDVKGLSMYKISGTIGNSIDTMLISAFINTATTTLVGNYTLIKTSVKNVLMQFFTAVIPSVGNLAAEKDSHKQEIVFNRLFYISFLMVNFCSVGLYVLSKPFIRVWLGEEYILGQDIAFVIAFDFFLYILLQAIASFRTANGLFVKGQYRPLITTIINVGLSFLLIIKYGIFGTVLATIIARLLSQWYDPYLLYRYIFHIPFRRFYLKYWYYILIFVSGAFLTEYVISLVSLEGIISNLILSAVITMILPNLWAVLFTFWTAEFKYVKKLAGRVLHGKKRKMEE